MLVWFSSFCIIVVVLKAATHLEAMGRVGRALADETRCRILVELAAGPAYPSELATRLGESRSKISNHLSCLRGCGLVLAVWEGKKVRYEVADPRLTHALADLLSVVLAVDPGAQCLDEHAELSS
jgi:ArsR family transcriptional regulator, cadmium/lead-responsive transcriptional repressor